MIVTLIWHEINYNLDEISCISKNHQEILAKHDMLTNKTKEYKLTCNYRDYILKCPILNIPGCSQPVILCSPIKIPRKKFPSYVYLYAVALYLSNDLSMRKVAQIVRKTFGLDTFSHSTISRTLKRLAVNKDKFFESGLQHIKNTLRVRARICKSTDMETADTLLSALQPILDNPKTYGSSLIYTYYCLTGGEYPI